MKDDDGRHRWTYLEDDEDVKNWPQSYADKYYLGLPLVSLPGLIERASALDPVARAIDFFL